MRICGHCLINKPDDMFDGRSRKTICNSCDTRIKHTTRPKTYRFYQYSQQDNLNPLTYSRLFCERINEATARAIGKYERKTGNEAPPHLQAILSLVKQLQTEIDTAAVLTAEDASRARLAKKERQNYMLRLKKQGVREVEVIRAKLAWAHRLNGHSWDEVVETFGFSSPGHAHNVVHGGDGRHYAPARDEEPTALAWSNGNFLRPGKKAILYSEAAA